MDNRYNYCQWGYTANNLTENCAPGYPQMPNDINCPTISEDNTFQFYKGNPSARENLVNSQQSGGGGGALQNNGFNQKSSTTFAPCNPPTLIIANCLTVKKWTTMITPLFGGATKARFVYFTGVDASAQNPTDYIFLGYELATNPATGVMELYQLIELGRNICAVVGC
ncbi:hypothetical protein CON78_05810 [Bacillus toyonensis]|uniref:hypothetical protein n=1 Tax=Bacillus toyonensis TaxID=155322 RepID=UPI000BED0226|nr:hypothetical protein [Bacillus toyonensis]PEE00899.1 hypothetical protein CON78_05810 [Bacillus toyonensis]PFX89872.1 hypothetical protein COL40_04960 [Bacillus toyonensis]